VNRFPLVLVLSLAAAIMICGCPSRPDNFNECLLALKSMQQLAESRLERAVVSESQLVSAGTLLREKNKELKEVNDRCDGIAESNRACWQSIINTSGVLGCDCSDRQERHCRKSCERQKRHK
jgi:hypothetical protein